MATMITIDAETTRQAVLSALWECGWMRSSEEGLYSEFGALAAAVVTGDEATTAEMRQRVDREMDVLLSTVRGVETVTAARLGDVVQIDASDSELAEALSRCQSSVTEHTEAFWSATPAGRERMMAIHDAAERLRSDLNGAP